MEKGAGRHGRSKDKVSGKDLEGKANKQLWEVLYQMGEGESWGGDALLKLLGPVMVVGR